VKEKEHQKGFLYQSASIKPARGRRMIRKENYDRRLEGIKKQDKLPPIWGEVGLIGALKRRLLEEGLQALVEGEDEKGKGGAPPGNTPRKGLKKELLQDL